MDWTAVAAWVGAIGGLSGFASLGATSLWRWQDQQKAKIDRITVAQVSGGEGGLAFWLRYNTDPISETLRAEVRVLSGSAAGPHVDEYRVKPSPAPGFVGDWEGPTQSLRRAVLPLRWYTTTPADVRSAHLVIHGKPGPKHARIKVTVRGEASGGVYARRTLYVSP